MVIVTKRKVILSREEFIEAIAEYLERNLSDSIDESEIHGEITHTIGSSQDKATMSFIDVESVVINV